MEDKYWAVVLLREILGFGGMIDLTFVSNVVCINRSSSCKAQGVIVLFYLVRPYLEHCVQF